MPSAEARLLEHGAAGGGGAGGRVSTATSASALGWGQAGRGALILHSPHKQLVATCLEIKDAEKDGKLTRTNMLWVFVRVPPEGDLYTSLVLNTYTYLILTKA